MLASIPAISSEKDVIAAVAGEGEGTILREEEDVDRDGVSFSDTLAGSLASWGLDSRLVAIVIGAES